MGLGITGTIQLAATLVFAIPVGVFGLNTFLAGQRLLGGGAMVVAALMVLLPHYLTTPGDIPMKLGEKVVGKAVKVPDDDEE
jgi:hypothetical protein